LKGALPSASLNIQQEGEISMEHTMTIKQCLETLSKEELVDLGENQGLDSPKKLKKAHLIKHLSQVIPSKFEENVQYLTPEELKVFTGEHEAIDKKTSFRIGKEDSGDEDDDFSIPDLLEDMESGVPMDDFFDALDQVQEEMFSNIPQWLSYLINNGYAFLTEDEQPSIQVPSEIFDVYTKQTKENSNVFSFQHYLFASVNLYGVCSYQHLHKLYTEHTASDISLKDIRNHVTRFVEKRQKLNANKAYFYHPLLQAEDLVPLINSDIETYYMPNRKEINTYSIQLFGTGALERYNQLKDLLLTKTKIEETLTGMLIGYEDALEEDAIDILYDYEEIVDYLPYCLKMGKEPNQYIQKLDQLSIRFEGDNDRSTLQSLYLQTLEKTRKWSLKGALNA